MSLLRDEDLKVEALGRPPGGQHFGMETGVRVTHLPSGLMAECKTERSQHRNKAIALDMILGGLTSPHYRG
jgi:protein subunit release factor A